MTVGWPELPEETKRIQADPNHAAGVLASIFRGLSAPAVSRATGLPSTNRVQQATPTANPTATSAAPPTESTGFGHPYEGEDPAVASPFGGARGHGGIDLSVPVGSNMIAAISGTVTHAAGDDPGGYGNWVEITGAGGISVRYGHLSEIDVQEGDTVQQGQVIGRSGGQAGAPGSGNSSGPHLHFEVRQDGQPVDPAPFLAGGAAIVGSAKTETNEAGVTTAQPLSPEQVMSAQLTNIADVVAGKQPSTPATQLVTSEPQTMGTPNEPGVPGNASGNWAEDILAGIGAPITPENVRLMNAWMQAEGMGAELNNPLATTQPMDGEVGTINSVGVRHYATYEQGLAATVRTILNGHYGGIIAALMAGDNALAAADAIAASPWGTGGLVKKILGGG